MSFGNLLTCMILKAYYITARCYPIFGHVPVCTQPTCVWTCCFFGGGGGGQLSCWLLQCIDCCNFETQLSYAGNVNPTANAVARVLSLSQLVAAVH